MLEPVARRGFLATVFGAVLSSWLPKKKMPAWEKFHAMTPVPPVWHGSMRGESYDLVYFDELCNPYNFPTTVLMRNISGKKIEAGQMVFSNQVAPLDKNPHLPD